MQVPMPRLKKINKAYTTSSPKFSLSKLVKQNETHVWENTVIIQKEF